MSKTLNCPECGGPSINRAPKYQKGPDGVMHRATSSRCYYLGGFSGRRESQCRAFWCAKKEPAQ